MSAAASPPRRATALAGHASCAATSARRRRRSAPSARSAVAELHDWEALRDAGAAIKARAMATLPEQLERLEARVTRAGGTVHWARDGAEANAIVARHRARARRARGHQGQVAGHRRDRPQRGARSRAASRAIETDLAELIVQLGDDKQSHILVPAIHRNRAEIAALFERTIAQGQELGLRADARSPRRPAGTCARSSSRCPSRSAARTSASPRRARSCVVESEGNGRMCTTLPEVLITRDGHREGAAGVARPRGDAAAAAALLDRRADEPVHVAVDRRARRRRAARSSTSCCSTPAARDVLADEVGRQALHCIRCSACLNVCPVYSRVGGHAYESVYPGPIGAILTPQLQGLDQAPTLPWASSLCGACYEVCPVKIDIPTVLVHLRGRVVREAKSRLAPERAGDGRASAACSARAARYERAQRLAQAGRGPLRHAPAAGLDARCATCPRCPSARSATGGRRSARRRERARGGPASGSARALGAGRRASRRSRAPTAGRAPGRRPATPRSSRASASAPPSTGRPSGASRAGELADAVAAALRRARRAAHRGRRRGAGVAATGVERVADDPPLSPRDLDALDGVLTGCALAIAETGTIVLDGGPRSGRRALTLVPDLHVCVVEAARRPRRRARRDRGARAARPPRAGRSRSSPARARRPTSSSSASRACTARARS